MTLYHLIDLPCDGRNYTVVVSEKWLLLQNRQCYYPPTEEKVKLMKLLRDHCPPDPITWPLYNNIVDRTRPYVSLEKAWRDIDPAIEHTDFQQSETEEEEFTGRSRRRIKQKQVFSPQTQRKKQQGAGQDHGTSLNTVAVTHEPKTLSDVPMLSLPPGFNYGSFPTSEQLQCVLESSRDVLQYDSCSSATSLNSTFQHSNPPIANFPPTHLNYQEVPMENVINQQTTRGSQSGPLSHFQDANADVISEQSQNDEVFRNQQLNVNLNTPNQQTNGNQPQSYSQQYPMSTFSQHPPNPQLPPTNHQVEGNFHSASRVEVNNLSGAFVPVPSRSHSSARLPNIPNPPPRTACVPLNGSAVDTSQVVNNSQSASQQFPIRTFSQHPPNPQLPPTNQVEGNFPSASTSENSRLEVNNVSGAIAPVGSAPSGSHSSAGLSYFSNPSTRTASVPLNISSADMPIRRLSNHSPGASALLNERHLLSGNGNGGLALPVVTHSQPTEPLSSVIGLPGASGNAGTDEILERLREQSKLIDFLIRGSNMVSTPRTTAFDEILPLDTIAKLLDFEQCLEREENRSNFVSVIQSIGGKSLNDVVVRCMEEIVSDCVAKDINWEGELRKGVQKHSFSKSKIKTVLFDTLKPSFQGKTFYDMEVCVKNWLRHAPNRYKKSLQSTRAPRRRRR